MSLKCDYCHKGVAYGHMVSHAKNRLRRIFKPNLQKLRVLKNGLLVRVKFCTRCIKRLKKDGKMGIYTLRKIASVKEEVKLPKVEKVKEAVPQKKEKKTGKEKPKTEKVKKETKENKAKETLDIEAIVGKKS